jgi:OOP family OmpA-OmpF porin
MGAAMAAPLKFLIGLALALAAGWLSHGPLGRGEAFIGGMEHRAKGMIEIANVPGVDVHFSRDPLSREAVFTGHANDFQRNGQGDFLGLDGRIMLIPGVSGVRWEEDE